MTPCCICKGPFHPATGHAFSEKLVWCGPCTRDFVKFLKTQTSRRWGKLPFYKHAVPPPAKDTSFEDTRGDPMVCHCQSCTARKQVLPVHNKGRFEAVKGAGMFAGAKEWGVIGPAHGVEHMGLFWECENEAEARELAAKLSAGWVPPPEDTCDGCKKVVPAAVLVSKDSPKGRFAFCPECQ